MRKFDYLFLKEAIPGRLIRLAEDIAELRTKESFYKKSNEDTFAALKERTVFDSVCSSNEIDGVTTTDARIRALINGDYPTSKDEAMIRGYADSLDMIGIQHEKLSFDEELILNIHKMIFGNGEQGSMSSSVSGYKTEDIYIFGMGADGSNRVRLNPVAADEIPAAIAELTDACNAAMRDPEVPKLFMIPCVVLDFLRIQPFGDGNERISRLLGEFLLFKSGLDICTFVPLSKLLQKRKDEYYSAIEKSSDNWAENENDYLPFIEFMLQMIKWAYHELDDNFIEVTRKKASKQERIESILMNTFVPVSKNEIMERLPDVSVRTVEVTLKRLLDEGKISKVGSFRDARYKKK
ncbi:MAG: Fic family protein [Eubacterium sp.]|nr:Fic family protein [Eubacterium sp.]